MVMLATKILARLLVASGAIYVQKFIEKSGGMVVLQHRLRRWWSIPTVWPLCFAIIFGIDISNIAFDRPFDLFSLIEIFASRSDLNIVYPAILPVITTMLEAGLRIVTRDQSDPDSPLVRSNKSEIEGSVNWTKDRVPLEQRSMNLIVEPLALGKFQM